MKPGRLGFPNRDAGSRAQLGLAYGMNLPFVTRRTSCSFNGFGTPLSVLLVHLTVPVRFTAPNGARAQNRRRTENAVESLCDACASK